MAAVPDGRRDSRPPPARPNLHIAPTNLNQVRIWWTNTSETFTLERTNRLGTLPNAWIYVTNQSPYVGPAINTAEFYRLKF